MYCLYCGCDDEPSTPRKMLKTITPNKAFLLPPLNNAAPPIDSSTDDSFNQTDTSSSTLQNDEASEIHSSPVTQKSNQPPVQQTSSQKNDESLEPLSSNDDLKKKRIA